jgi:8-amino-7-oxononanoate synthase
MPYPFLRKRLDARAADGSLRALRQLTDGIDFSSNDYLGLAQHPGLKERILHKLLETEEKIGATGSRLLTGNSSRTEQLEARLAQFHHAESGLLFQSGYAANIGLLASIPQEGDTVLYDQFVHASLRDGIRLSRAQARPFKHNDLSDLEKVLKTASGNVFIVVESVYSMDGDLCPLQDLVRLAKANGAHIILDEAHSTGIFGPNGEGLAVAENIENQIFARLHTFGKAMGCHGAVVVGSQLLREYLINFARPFVFSTGMALTEIMAIEAAYELLAESSDARQQLWDIIHFFNKIFATPNGQWQLNPSPVQSLVVPGNVAVVAVGAHLRQHGINALPIRYPSVPKGGERLRFCLHAYNRPHEVAALHNLLDRQRP